MTALQTFVFLTVVAFAFAIGPTCRAAQAGASELPPDMLAFVDRRARCHEWSVKAMEPEHAAESESAWRARKCAELAQDERALREKYAGDPGVLAAFDATWRIIVRRVPVQIAPESEPSGSDR
jgi:hypothetical protein